MEGNRFDAVVKSVAGGSTRRAMVVALLGVGAGAIARRVGVEPAAAAPNPQRRRRQPCENNLDCPRRQVCITVAGGKKNCVSAGCGKHKNFCRNADFHACCDRGTTCCVGSQTASCCETLTTCDPRGLCVT